MPKRLTSVPIRQLLALATALAGVMNVFSALFPAFHWRYLLLKDMVPVNLINDSTVGTVLMGMVLILLADGLAKRQRRAMLLTLLVLTASSMLHLLKGLDYEEAVICLVLACVLLYRQADYVVKSKPISLRGGLPVVLSFVLLYFSYDLLGFRILRAWITPMPTLSGAAVEPIRLLFDGATYHYHGYQAHWFGMSLWIIGAAALVVSSTLILRPLIPIHKSNTRDREHARSIILRHGQDTLSYFALRHDRAYFFNSQDTAFLSYKIWRNVALVGGDPIGPADHLAGLTSEFVEFCAANGLLPCFLGAGADHLGLYRSLGLRVLKIGEECLIRLPSFEPANLKRKVRRAERHCLEMGLTTQMFSAGRLPEGYRRAAADVSCNWVRCKGGSERGFSMTLGRFPLQQDDGRILVAERNGDLVGFLTFVPVYAGNGWSLDMMRRGTDSPNGLTEFMIIQAARIFQEQGAEFMSLNFASLSSTEAVVGEPRLIGSLRRFLFDNLSSVYQLKSLYQFNTKFDPVWTSRYMVYGDLMRAPKIIMAVMQAEDPIKLSTVAAVFRR